MSIRKQKIESLAPKPPNGAAPCAIAAEYVAELAERRLPVD
jgi:hypothetical protein